MYDKNCGKKMFSKKIYPAPGENLADQVAFKGMSGKRKEFMLKQVPNPKNLEERRVPMGSIINIVSGKISVSCQQEENCYPPFSKENNKEKEG